MIVRVRIIRDENTQEEISQDRLDITSQVFYNTNVFEQTAQPDESVDSPNYILLRPNIDIVFGDWIEKDNLLYKIRKISKIIYNSTMYPIKVEY